MLQTGQTTDGLGSGAHGNAEVSFQRTLAHGGVAGDGGDGSTALGVADQVYGGLDLRRDGEFRFGVGVRLERKRSIARNWRWIGTGAGQDVLDMVDLLPWQNVVERERSIVKKVDSVVQDCRARRPQ